LPEEQVDLGTGRCGAVMPREPVLRMVVAFRSNIRSSINPLPEHRHMQAKASIEKTGTWYNQRL